MEIDRKLADLAASHHGIFSGRHLDQLGVSRGERRRRFEDGSWIRIHDGAFRIAGAPLTSRGELLAACWAGGDRAVASHRSAASLWGLPGGSNAITEITCPRWRRSRHEGLIVHESTLLTSADMTEVDRIPCTSVERTIFDMCGTGGAALADLLLDSALRRRLTTISGLVVARDRLSRRGRRGAAHFRAAVDRRDPSAALPESAPERMIARFIERNGLPTPVHQYVVKRPEPPIRRPGRPRLSRARARHRVRQHRASQRPGRTGTRQRPPQRAGRTRSHRPDCYSS